MKFITLTLKERGKPDRSKQLAFGERETVGEVIEAGRKGWGFSPCDDLRLCKPNGHVLPFAEKVGELHVDQSFELCLVYVR